MWLLRGPGESLLRAGRNIPWLRLRTYDTVSAHDLFYSERILMSPVVADKLAVLLRAAAAGTAEPVADQSEPAAAVAAEEDT